VRDVFTEHSIPWTANYDGMILGFNGHLHDGGTGVRIYKTTNTSNDGRPLCTSATRYAKTPMTGLKGAFDKHHFEMEHIVSQDLCVEERGIPLKKGDQLYFQADYDLTKYPGMKNSKGQFEEIGGVVGGLFTYP